MKALILFLALGAIPSSAGTCFSDKTCRLGCCESTGPGAPCWCSACCLSKTGAPDDIARIYRDAKRAAFVYRHRIEFYDLKGLTPGLTMDDGKPKPLRDDAEARGRPVLLGLDGKAASAKPRSVRLFKDGIYPFSGGRSRLAAFLVCTDAAWGTSSAAAAEAGFCGALSLDGKMIFRLSVKEEAGVTREPAGISEDASEALFALTKKRPDGAREIVGYRLWHGGRVERLDPDGPRAKALVEKYEGPLVLPSQEQGRSPR
ncbi:MAG: hypothetical protein PHS14_11295 [Elusimicrobia bacterium]|nr:hypothetical protein [Elusimicrobiota bacterium]